jgi:hypothetical protein
MVHGVVVQITMEAPASSFTGEATIGNVAQIVSEVWS